MRSARTPRFASVVACALALASCGTDLPPNHVASVEFDPDPAVVAGGVCAATALFRELEGSAVNLLSATMTFTDAVGATGEFEFDADALSAILDSMTVPANGSVTGPFAFDLGSKGLVLPCEGTMVAVGAGNDSNVTHFLGGLRCAE